jgi:23S rRNA pseudouridine1911/1915/1917 synthase
VSLVQCRLITGRTHQIRVHLAARGWPIVGDPTYGEPRWQAIAAPAIAGALEMFPRQALHAWRLPFAHPITSEPVSVEAPLPDDMRTLIDVCGLDVPGSARAGSLAEGLRRS